MQQRIQYIQCNQVIKGANLNHIFGKKLHTDKPTYYQNGHNNVFIVFYKIFKFLYMCKQVFMHFSLVLDKNGNISEMTSRLHIWELVTSVQVLSAHQVDFLSRN